MSAHPPPSALQTHIERLAAAMRVAFPDAPFLRDVAAARYGAAVDDVLALTEAVARSRSDVLVHPGHPLAALATAGKLSAFEVDLLVFALLPELDERFGDVLQGLGYGRRPTLGLGVHVLLGSGVDRGAVRAHLARELPWSLGLLRAPDDHLPFFDRPLSPTPTLLATIEGRAPPRLSTGALVRLDAAVPDPVLVAARPSLAELAADVGRWAAAVGTGVVHVVARREHDATELVAAVAHRVGAPALVVEVTTDDAAAVREIVAAAFLLGAVPVVRARGDRLTLETSPLLRGPLVLVTAVDAHVAMPAGVPARRIVAPSPRPGEQAALWAGLLAGRGEAEIDVLANQTHLAGRDIVRVVTLAAESAGPRAIVHADVAAALDEVVPAPHTPMGRTSRPRTRWAHLVVPKRPREQLDELLRRIRYRVTVQERWGMGGEGGRGEGLVAMLHGESGTGKTLAAEAIASSLTMPLVSVDLSRVVSKYIGETEKHLSTLFDVAEGFRAVLFFDEADALFGKRTGVKDAHDRYANIETNYLLQRLEAFEGVALLATNLLQNIDSAFLRRLQFVVAFPRPNAALRRLIWRNHLPAARLAQDVDLDTIARVYDVVGGEIRNAALGAAYVAAAAEGAITDEMLHDAVRDELTRRGRSVPQT